jgi:hypothetical protein
LIEGQRQARSHLNFGDPWSQLRGSTSLLRCGTLPQLQILFFDDGSIYPSLYHLGKDMEFRRAPGTITESDMYFPEQKLAVFCDSARWHRGARVQAKDQAVSAQLSNKASNPCAYRASS